MGKLGHTLRLAILSKSFKISSDGPEAIQVLRFQYRHFLVPPAAGEVDHQIDFRLIGPRPTLSVDGHRMSLPPSPHRTAHALGLAFETLLDSIDGYMFIHAGVVARAGRGLLICGPPGFGKTSLVLNLVDRGCQFLSDDLAPLSLSTGWIAPFPRSLGIVARPRHRASLGDRVPREARLRFGGKWLIDPGAVPGLRLGGSSRPALVVLLGPAESTSGRILPRFEIAIHPSLSSSLSECFKNTDTRPRKVRKSSRIVVYRVTPGATRAVTSRLQAWVRDHRPGVLWLTRITRPAGTFRSPLRITPVPPKEGIVEILEDLLNRRPGSRGLRALGGSPGLLLLKTADLLHKIPFYRLRGGGIKARSDAVERLLRESGQPEITG